jgi:hypothetical protein
MAELELGRPDDVFPRQRQPVQVDFDLGLVRSVVVMKWGFVG